MIWYLVLSWCSGSIQGVNICAATMIPQGYSQLSDCRSDGIRAVKDGFSAYRCVATGRSS